MKVNTLLYVLVIKLKITLVCECATFSTLPHLFGVDFVMRAHIRKYNIRKKIK